MCRLEKKLKSSGFSLDQYRQTQKLMEDQRFTLGFNGRGKYRDMFHVSCFESRGPDGAIWKSYLNEYPDKIILQPGKVMTELREL